MILNHRVEDQMASSLCFLRNPLPWVAVLVPVLIFAGFLGFGFFFILITSSALILSTVLFTFSKQRPLMEEESLKEEEEIVRSDDHESLPHMEEAASLTQPETDDSMAEKDETQEEGGMRHLLNEYMDESPGSLSKTEILDQSSTSDESEVEWAFPENAGQSPESSDDGSISDEESLIEIALLSGHYVEPKQEDPEFNLQKKLPDSIFQHHSALMELLTEMNEMNEEENLIEIDISMGSIKCSRFEIEA